MKILGIGALSAAAVIVIAALKSPKRAKEGNRIETMAFSHGNMGGKSRTNWWRNAPL